MTTFKHALGYNKDGVLGVAGLLGGNAGILEELGFIGWPTSGGGYSNDLTNFGMLLYGASEPTISADQVNPSTPQYSASGNGIIALGFANSYVPVGQSLLKVVDALGSVRDVEIDGVPTLAINYMYGGQTPISLAAISFAEDTFIVSYYDQTAMTHRYVTTEDFETFSGPYASPAFGFARYLYKASNGDYIASDGTMSGYRSSDLITWTSQSLYLNPYLSNRYGRLYPIGKLSDGRQVFEANDSAEYIAIPEDAKIGDIFNDFAGLVTTLGAVPSDFRYGYAGIVDDLIVGGGYMGNSSVSAYDLSGQYILSNSLGNVNWKRTITVNDYVYVYTQEMDSSKKLFRITSASPSGAGIEYEELGQFAPPATTMGSTVILPYNE